MEFNGKPNVPNAQTLLNPGWEMGKQKNRKASIKDTFDITPEI